jgi:RNA polymerase-binding transcription factor DksA
MEIGKARALAARLAQRKQQISATLTHLESERSEMERNTDWKDAWARQRRQSLFNYLNRWYKKEMNEINRALERVSTDKYGACASCNCAIEGDWLETFPEAEYCRVCQQTIERLERR